MSIEFAFVMALYLLGILIYFLSSFYFPKSNDLKIIKEDVNYDSKVKTIERLINIFVGGVLFYVFIIRLLLGWEFNGGFWIHYTFYFIAFAILDVCILGYQIEPKYSQELSINYLFSKKKNWYDLRDGYAGFRKIMMIISVCFSLLCFITVGNIYGIALTIDSPISLIKESHDFDNLSQTNEPGIFGNGVLSEFGFRFEQSNGTSLLIYKERLFIFKSFIKKVDGYTDGLYDGSLSDNPSQEIIAYDGILPSPPISKERKVNMGPLRKGAFWLIEDSLNNFRIVSYGKRKDFLIDKIIDGKHTKVSTFTIDKNKEDTLALIN